MDDDGGLGIRNWGSYYDQPRKGLGLQLMSSVAPERDTKPLLSNGAFLLHQHRGGVPEPAIPIEYMRTSDGRWIHHQRDSNKILHVLPGNHHHPNYAAVLADNPHAQTHTHTHTHNPHAHTLQMLQQSPPPPDPSNDDRAAPPMDEAGGGSRKDMPPKKRSSQGRPGKSPKAKKPKKAPAPRDESNDNGSAPKVKAARKSAGLVINGIDMDISRFPTPVCSCTGTPQPCYRWGIGGWQSACCTTSMSMYPLPMSTKRRGARIAGRKMSQGAFKKVLEMLDGEGYNLSNPIDLRAHWAKHGTNKFVTIR